MTILDNFETVLEQLKHMAIFLTIITQNLKPYKAKTLSQKVQLTY